MAQGAQEHRLLPPLAVLELGQDLRSPPCRVAGSPTAPQGLWFLVGLGALGQHRLSHTEPLAGAAPPGVTLASPCPGCKLARQGP